tara:strand:- start:875 stop:1765 length:891 start_codon:yes stop_codon:yes gene_type:complete
MNQLTKTFIENISKLKIVIIGETIVDEYHWIELMGSSPKSKCPSGVVLKTESYQGGTAYIHRIIKNFCNNVEFITGDPIVKTRYLEESFNTKYLELKSDDNTPIDIESFNEVLDDSDLIIIADFGHSLFNRSTAEYLEDLYADKIALMCQTNSSNYGYNNLYPKWQKAAYVCLDQKEFGLILQHKDPSPEHLYNLWDFLKFDIGTLTLGKEGSFTMGGSSEYRTSCITNGTIVDTIGAGDTFFALASLAYACGMSPKDIGFLGSLGGYYNTTFPATKRALTVEKLDTLIIKHGDRI